LTAAHCVDSIVRVEVYLGAISRVDGVGAFIKAINVTDRASIIPHPRYNEILISDDIGLVRLPEDAPIVQNVTGLVLLPQGLDATRNLVGLTGTVSGFGELNKNSSNFVN
jgi:hypothetical protein